MQTEVIVRFGDLDPYNHVNHSRYFTYFESARIEALEEIGFGMSRMLDTGIQIVLVEVRAGFHMAAGLHDRLVISTQVVDVGRTTTTWRQEARLDGDLVVSLEVKAAFTNLEGRPRRVPEGFADAVQRLG